MDGCRQVDETGETFLEEDVVEWIETDVHPVRGQSGRDPVRVWTSIRDSEYADESHVTITTGVKGERNY